MEAEIVKLEKQIDPLVAANNHYKMMVAFVKEQMRCDVDYGVIPGTNNKPVLLKPGAEKLCRLFSLYPQLELIQSITDFEKPLFHYHYRCTIYRQGEPVGQGEGSCNSKEKKYEKQAYKVYDLINTICKIAQKRAMVSAVLVAVGASEFFTCDLEPEEAADQSVQQRPNNRGDTAHKGDGEPVPNRLRLISDPQVKRFQTIARSNGYSTPGAKALLAEYGFASSRHITIDVYDRICSQAADKELAAAFNSKAQAAS